MTNNDKIDWLKFNWENTCSDLSITSDIDNTFKYLLYLYNDPRRRYHNIDHIFNSLYLVSSLKDEYKFGRFEEAKINLVLWFHDAVYNILANDNEYRSGLLVSYFVYRQPRSTVSSQELENIILLTNHKEFYEDMMENSMYLVTNCVLDIDLAGLGSSPSQYTINSNLIFQEYASEIDAIDFLKGRIKFLENMTSRKNLYYTELFKRKYETQAYNNMINELNILKNNV